jgi:peptide/nickel transport system permease protein
MSSQASEPLNIPQLVFEPGAAESLAATPLSPGQLAWRRFKRHRMAVAGSIGLILVILFIIVGSFVYSEKYANRLDVVRRLEAPSVAHYFGTDSTGRDMFARIIYGGQISLFIGILSVAVALILGITIGGVAGLLGGWVDSVLMRFTEAVLSIPSLFLLIILGKLFGDQIPTLKLLGRTFSGSVIVVIMVIGLTSWMYLARIVRANILSLREMDYVSAARALGAGNLRVLVGHLIPNTMMAIIVTATLGLAQAIISEAYVSFLGLGVQPPTASWGNLMDQSISLIQRGVWWMWVFPSLFIVMTILFTNFIGDGLRDALDPRSTRHL